MGKKKISNTQSSPANITKDQLLSLSKELESLNKKIRNKIDEYEGIKAAEKTESKETTDYGKLFMAVDTGLAIARFFHGAKEQENGFYIEEANPAFAQMIEVPLTKILKKNFTEVFSDKPFVESLVRNAGFALRNKNITDELYSNKPGKYFQIQYIRSEENQVALIFHDVTEHRKEINRQRQQLALVMEMADHAIFNVSKTGKVLTWNKGAEELYGYTGSDIINKSAEILEAFPNSQESREWRDKVLKGEPLKNHESLHKSKDGKMISVMVTKSLIEDENDQVAAVATLVKDVSVIKNREQELIMARKETERASRAKATFLSNMSHEIRTPLNSILGFANILKNMELGAEQKTIVETIYHSGQNLLALITDIIDVSRIEAAEIKIHVKSFPLNEIMRSIKDEFRARIFENKQQKINFLLHLTNSNPIIQADPYRLKQVLENLLDNAFKFTNSGQVEFGYVIRNYQDILFYVKDTGRGISTKNQKIIFERFQQGEIISGKTTKGTGLGLAICKGIVDLMQGEIWVNSEPGKGTEMYFTIPYIKGKSETKPKDVKSGSKIPDLSGKTVLIVEDDTYSLEMIRYLVEKTGATYLLAEDGEKAVDLFDKNNIDFILLDIRLPKKNGYEVLKLIRRANPDVPVVAETAHAMREEILSFSKMGFTDYLLKPIDQNELYHLMRKYLS